VVFPTEPRGEIRENPCAALMVFVPLTELRSVRASSLTRALLSWVSSSVPLCRCPCSRPLPVRKRTFGQPVPTRRRVPFSWFLTTSTVCSGCSFAGLLRPATSSRFVAFPASLPANCRNNRGGSQDAFPGDASHTLQSFPLASSRTASPTSCCSWLRRNAPKSGLGGSPTAVALMTFPPVRLAAFHNPVARTASNCDLPESAAFKALLHCRVRCDTPSLLIAPRSLLPWA
jgi:hypothetical protein